MPVAVIATGIASAVAAAVAIYSYRKRAEQKSDARIDQRLASVALRDSIATSNQRSGA